MPNPDALAAMEATTGHIAESLHHMMGSITANLHAISGKTRVCVGAYGGAVDDLGDNVDETIQMMYQLIMYCEKISQNMQYVYALSDQLYPPTLYYAVQMFTYVYMDITSNVSTSCLMSVSH
eukprot:scpid112560/ scgid15867/ 